MLATKIQWNQLQLCSPGKSALGFNPFLAESGENKVWPLFRKKTYHSRRRGCTVHPDVYMEDTILITSKVTQKGWKEAARCSWCLWLSGSEPRSMIDAGKNTSSPQSQQCRAYLLQCHWSNVMGSRVPQRHQTPRTNTCFYLYTHLQQRPECCISYKHLFPDHIDVKIWNEIEGTEVLFWLCDNAVAIRNFNQNWSDVWDLKCSRCMTTFGFGNVVKAFMFKPHEPTTHVFKPSK